MFALPPPGHAWGCVSWALASASLDLRPTRRDSHRRVGGNSVYMRPCMTHLDARHADCDRDMLLVRMPLHAPRDSCGASRRRGHRVDAGICIPKPDYPGLIPRHACGLAMPVPQLAQDLC